MTHPEVKRRANLMIQARGALEQVTLAEFSTDAMEQHGMLALAAESLSSLPSDGQNAVRALLLGVALDAENPHGADPIPVDLIAAVTRAVRKVYAEAFFEWQATSKHHAED
jgi:hypothetical protein